MFATVEEYGVRNGMALPAAKAVPHCRPIAVDRRSNRHETYPAAAITLLQHRTQVGRQDIRLDERISEIGDTHRTGLCRQLIQRAIERCHAAQGGVAVILNAGHAAATGIHKGGLHFRGGGNRLSGSLTTSGTGRTSPSMSTRLNTWPPIVPPAASSAAEVPPAQ